MSTETLAETNEAPEATETAETREFAGHMDKEPTHLHNGYAVYLKDKVGYGPEAPAEGEEPSAEWKHFVKTIQLAVVLYGKYQKSPENAARKIEEAKERDAKAAQAKAAKEEAAKQKAAEKEAAKEKAAAEAEAEGTEAVPGKKAVKPKAAKAKAAASNVEAPF